MNSPDAQLPPVALKHLRLLKWHELVMRGDFVADGHRGFQPWEGPSGFRADAFKKRIYRRRESSPEKVKDEE